MPNVQPHIRCSEKDKADYALLPGDPARLDRIKIFLTDVTEIAYNREHRSLSGFYKGIKVMAVSTGMGAPSTGIALEELVNIGVKAVVRVGSCGVLQAHIDKGELVIASGAVRDDGTSKAYIDSAYPAVPDTVLLNGLIKSADSSAFKYHVGLVRSHDSFYTDKEEQLASYWAARHVLGADMETAAIFTISSLRGISAASVLNTVSGHDGDLKNDINQYVDDENAVAEGEAHSIQVALDAFVEFEKRKSLLVGR